MPTIVLIAVGSPGPVRAAEPCGNTLDADICIMIDRTGSTSASELLIEVDAVTDLLADFDTIPFTKPRVAIGSFHGPCVNAQSGCPAPAPNCARSPTAPSRRTNS